MTTDANPNILTTAEGQRLAGDEAAWRRWGPYLAERQWGTVREDYSADGDAWRYFPHEQARSRAYRWGEDGIGGFCDEQMRWCLSVAFWNGQDEIIKERLFGLSNPQGNHGEDVKELYFHEDGTPSHAYMRMLYRYPQRAFPYQQLIAENARRDASQAEFDLLDTGIFAENRYFDITIEYAKAGPDDVLLNITIHNAADVPATLDVLPQLWARNTWSWDEPNGAKPGLQLGENGVVATHAELPAMQLNAEGQPQWLFCENETNPALFNKPVPGIYKDGINDFVVHSAADAIRSDQGSKCAARYHLDIPTGGDVTLRLRWRPAQATNPPFADFGQIITSRQNEADEFYAVLQRGIADEDARLVQRQALAGMLWSKQFYLFDVRRWLQGDSEDTPPPARWQGRNKDWQHLSCADILSMPDTWEYPWFAAWDLAFHAVTFALVDPAFAKSQLLALVQERYMHPNGQIPAYEWSYGDVNPPVQAWATWRVFQMDTALTGQPDHLFLERIFHKLLLNFTWWVNRKDAQGRNVFQGGFLGLDNIEIFDRSAPLPDGAALDQPDATGWMASYALTMMRIALELACGNRAYIDMAVKFFEHFLYIAAAMSARGDNDHDLWNEEDGFFYDLLHLPDGSAKPLKVRSFVGIVPLFAVHILESDVLQKLPEFAERLDWFLKQRPDLTNLISRWTEPNGKEFRLLSLLRGHRTKCLLRRILDESEFLSDHGIRSVSRQYLTQPFQFNFGGKQLELRYLPAESDSRLFGGNSNWRGPVWMSLNYLLVESLYEYHRYYGEDFKVECPTRSGQMLTLRQIADLLSQRLAGLTLRDQSGRRPVMAAYPALYADPAQSGRILFHEYYHGDNGSGLGAAHQTGWSGLVALLLQPRREHARADIPSCH
ncbi:MGH1-like glycoside hydrolase domain-containing protein [Silvimonas soli]|uniref:MGH1-like glycoside hydrolase domain-containing protein n=1 Tax=Silvimonas soli TaxID=2980100 RepID=UPI0024B3A441|nr:hypothetical protein [Silvimonas soli]